MLKTTPFHSRTAPLSEGQNWRRWAGHVVASSYDLLHDREYAAIRNSAALIDVSPLFKYVIKGRDALRLLDRVLPRDMTKSKVGQVMYTPWCDPAGKVIDDGTVSRLSEDTFRLTSADPNLRWLFQNALGLSASIEDVSESTGAVSLQGPLSRDILLALGLDVSGLKYFRVMAGTLKGIPVTISRTGYTGDLGYEIWVDAVRAVDLWDALAQVGELYGLVPSGILALDVARIEAGLLLLEVDYVSSHHALIDAQTSTPFELNLGWTVNLDKGPFVGKQALIEEKHRGAAWQFVGIEVNWESLERLYADVKLPPKLPTMAWRVSVPIYVGGRQVGYATSGCWSPILKKYIALAHLESSHAKLGSEVMMEVTVEHRRKQAVAKIVKTPFFDPERKRK
ncbi:MAG TPA: aminomethyltransferase family protein [Gemmatimonadales bacterium]|jgi:aminomethyltransferase|nr:aminomethyltransferase family protein [Gemmatimonadales bacterium]